MCRACDKPRPHPHQPLIRHVTHPPSHPNPDSSLPSLFVMLALLAATPALQLNGRAAPAVAPAAAPQTRRQLIQTAAAAAAAAAAGGVAPALAGGDTFNRMSGVLEPFTDVQKGFKLYKPVAWNQFEADPGVYDMKWVDLIEPFETVQVSTSPVSTATSISALGELDEARRRRGGREASRRPSSRHAPRLSPGRLAQSLRRAATRSSSPPRAATLTARRHACSRGCVEGAAGLTGTAGSRLACLHL